MQTRKRISKDQKRRSPSTFPQSVCRIRTCKVRTARPSSSRRAWSAWRAGKGREGKGDGATVLRQIAACSPAQAVRAKSYQRSIFTQWFIHFGNRESHPLRILSSAGSTEKKPSECLLARSNKGDEHFTLIETFLKATRLSPAGESLK